jgi:hypothetical protein
MNYYSGELLARVFCLLVVDLCNVLCSWIGLSFRLVRMVDGLLLLWVPPFIPLAMNIGAWPMSYRRCRRDMAVLGIFAATLVFLSARNEVVGTWAR